MVWKEYRQSHKKEISEYNKKYYAKNKLKILQKQKMRDKVMLEARKMRYRIRRDNDPEWRESERKRKHEWYLRYKAKKLAEKQKLQDEQAKSTHISGEGC